MGQVQNSIATAKIRINSRKPAWLTSNMIVTYALPVIEESIPTTYMEAEIRTESEM